jgi:Holliday junction resolvase-like predicted endonuclease
VKARRYQRDAEPMLEAVPRGKQRKIAETAVRYCQEHRVTPHMRFDVIAVAPDATGALRVVEHVPHAFTCESLGLFF